MRIFTKFVLFILMALTLSLVNAETTESVTTEAEENAGNETKEPRQYYIVEVILFKHLNEEGKKNEFWYRPENNQNNEPGESLTANSLNDDTPALATYNMDSRRFMPLRNGVEVLSSEHYKLSDSAGHLRYSPDFKLLAHFGWIQRSLSKSYALPVLIQANQFSDNLIPEGQLKLYTSRFLHMMVDLQSSECIVDETKPEAAIQAGVQANTALSADQKLDQQIEQGNFQPQNRIQTVNQCTNNTYLFRQSRKMRSKQLHYIDHPVYGILVYITPLEIDKTQATR
jgi:hypothetical protein